MGFFTVTAVTMTYDFGNSESSFPNPENDLSGLSKCFLSQSKNEQAVFLIRPANKHIRLPSPVTIFILASSHSLLVIRSIGGDLCSAGSVADLGMWVVTEFSAICLHSHSDTC
jgi:hypothetical protein